MRECPDKSRVHILAKDREKEIEGKCEVQCERERWDENINEEGIARHVINKSAFVCPMYDVREIAASLSTDIHNEGARLLSRPTRYVTSGSDDGGGGGGIEVCEYSRDKRCHDRICRNPFGLSRRSICEFIPITLIPI